MAKRDKDMQVNIEQAIYQTVVELTDKIGESQSNYIRNLIIADLRERGLLTDSMLADLLITARR